MSLDNTQTFANAYDSIRQAIGMDGPLKLVALVPGTGSTKGYQPILEVTAGWKAKRVTQRATGQQFFEIKIADVSRAVADAVRQYSLSHVLLGSLYYKVSGVDQPTTATRKWLIRCYPTGERKPQS